MAGLRARLKEATAAEHGALEAASPLSDPALTLPAYTAYLGRTWGYYTVLEPQVFATLARAPRPELDLPARRKTRWLEADLARLHGAMPSLPRCPERPRADTFGAALGCAYVLEGATLGGQVLYKRFHRRLGLDEHTGARFLRGYGDATAVMWQTFTQILDGLVLAPDAEIECIGAARATFATLGQWLGEHGAARHSSARQGDGLRTRPSHPRAAKKMAAP